ncbi:MAG: Asp-tRNA(Asn)/Glu-tRNA(Gln) amidotransferase subunit GatC [Patescibacteria group bacterium]
MALTQQDIEHIARLSRLELSGEELEAFTQQLSSILEYVAQLKEVDTKSITYHYQVPGLENIYDDDSVRQCSEEERALLLNAMPAHVGDFLKVKGVFRD